MNLDKQEIQEIINNKIKDGTKKYGKDFKYFILEILSLEKMLNPAVKESRLIPLAKWNDYHDYPKVGSLRQFHFYNTDNFNKCVVQNGKRVLLDENEVLNWLRNRNIQIV